MALKLNCRVQFRYLHRKYQMAEKSRWETQILLWLRCSYVTPDDKNTHNHMRQNDSEFFEVITPDMQKCQLLAQTTKKLLWALKCSMNPLLKSTILPIHRSDLVQSCVEITNYLRQYLERNHGTNNKMHPYKAQNHWV